MLTLWEDTDDCANQYRYAFDIFLITVLSSSYGIIMYRTVNAQVHRKNVVDGLYAT